MNEAGRRRIEYIQSKKAKNKGRAARQGVDAATAARSRKVEGRGIVAYRGEGRRRWEEVRRIRQVAGEARIELAVLSTSTTRCRPASPHQG